MDSVKIGKAIKALRIRMGYTQQELAERLDVTDKAVSKWERGLGVPDISIITSLSDFLNVDADNLLNGNIAYLEHEWEGLLLLDSFHTEIRADASLYDKPLAFLWICYFMLIGIREITICCNREERSLIEKILGDGSRLGLHLNYQDRSEPLRSANLMVMEDSIFLYGANLTKYFQRAMSQGTQVTELAVPKLRGKMETDAEAGNKNITSDIHVHEQTYDRLPIWFVKQGAVSVAKSVETLYAVCEKKKKSMIYLGKGMVGHTLLTSDELMDAAGFIRFLQKATGYYIYCPEEIAWRRGLISSEQLHDLAVGNGPKSEYLNLLLSQAENK